MAHADRGMSPDPPAVSVDLIPHQGHMLLRTTKAVRNTTELSQVPHPLVKRSKNLSGEKGALRLQAKRMASCSAMPGSNSFSHQAFGELPGAGDSGIVGAPTAAFDAVHSRGLATGSGRIPPGKEARQTPGNLRQSIRRHAGKTLVLSAVEVYNSPRASTASSRVWCGPPPAVGRVCEGPSAWPLPIMVLVRPRPDCSPGTLSPARAIPMRSSLSSPVARDGPHSPYYLE